MRVRLTAGLVLALGGVMATPIRAQDPPVAEAAEAADAATPAAEAAVPGEAATDDPQAGAATAVMEGAEPAAAADAAEPVSEASAPAAPVSVEPVFTSAKQIETSIGRIEGKEEPIAILSTMQIYWGVRSRAMSKGGIWNKHQSRKEIFAPMDKALLERVLVTLQDDLEARFEAAGWQARTRAELGADVPELTNLRVDDELGVPVHKYKDSQNELDSAVITLPGAGAPNPKAIGNGMAYMRYFKGKTGLNLNVTYTFAPGTVAETQSRMVGTEVGTGLWFSARADMIGAKGGWGTINVVADGLVVDSDVGTLDEIDGSRASVGENVIRYMGGLGTRDRTGYTMTPDWSKAEAAMLRAGRAFNAELVSRLAK